MNPGKYISKQLILRIGLLLLLVGGAAVFDMYHKANQKIADSARKIPRSDENESGKVYFYSQVTTYNFKTSGTSLSVRPVFACTQDKFLQKYYNLRTFQMMKAETVQMSFPSALSVRSIPYNRVLYASPDDTPPLG